jgi:chorismate dehydratase
MFQPDFPGGPSRPRVGHIQFLNCLPLYYGLVRKNGILDVDLVKGTPTELNDMIVRGDLDIGPVSSIEYARHADKLLLLPGPTVSCRGAVGSIILLSRYPLEELHERRVGLTLDSATSCVLLKAILSRRYGVSPRYFSFGGSLDEALSAGDAALLIGDRALENLSPPRGLHLYDLGREWKEMTGEGMVFAVWVVRREFAAARGALVEHVQSLFRASTAYFREHLREIAADASRWECFTADFLEEYFRTLFFDFNEDLRRGLSRFYLEAALLDELDSPPLLQFLNGETARRACQTGSPVP